MVRTPLAESVNGHLPRFSLLYYSGYQNLFESWVPYRTLYQRITLCKAADGDGCLDIVESDKEVN